MAEMQAGFGINNKRDKNSRIALFLFVFIIANFYSFLTVNIHVNYLGIHYLEKGHQIKCHIAVLQGKAADPWQYRVLADYLVEEVIQLCKKLNIDHPNATAFIFFRYIQGILIFLIGYLYYKKLGLPLAHSLIGISILAWGMTNANYESDLQFNTYFDILFYLLAGLVILLGKSLWIIPITLIAALNRETSGLIPFMLFASYLPIGTIGSKIFEIRKTRLKGIVVAAIALIVYLVVFFSLRHILGPRKLFIPYGQHPGFDLLAYNLLRRITWVQIFATLGIIPILAMMTFKNWPQQLKVYFWVIVPIWFIIHMFMSVMAETRLFLVPQALVFIPGALFLLLHTEKSIIGRGQT